MGKASIKRKLTGYEEAREVEKFAEEKYSLATPSLDILVYLYPCKKMVPIAEIRIGAGIKNRSTFTDRYMNPLVRKSYVRLRLNTDHTKDAIITDRGRNLVKKIFS